MSHYSHHTRYPKLKRVAATFNIVATIILIMSGLAVAVLVALMLAGNIPADAWGFFMQAVGAAISALFLLAIGGVIKVLMDIEENTRAVREHTSKHRSESRERETV